MGFWTEAHSQKKQLTPLYITIDATYSKHFCSIKLLVWMGVDYELIFRTLCTPPDFIAQLLNPLGECVSAQSSLR